MYFFVMLAHNSLAQEVATEAQQYSFWELKNDSFNYGEQSIWDYGPIKMAMEIMI